MIRPSIAAAVLLLSNVGRGFLFLPPRPHRNLCRNALESPPRFAIMTNHPSDGVKRDDTAPNGEDPILRERSKSALRYREEIAPGLQSDMVLHTVHHTTLSEFQEVQVIDTYFGRTLVTDGKTQSAEHDEVCALCISVHLLLLFPCNLEALV